MMACFSDNTFPEAVDLSKGGESSASKNKKVRTIYPSIAANSAPSTQTPTIRKPLWIFSLHKISTRIPAAMISRAIPAAHSSICVPPLCNKFADANAWILPASAASSTGSAAGNTATTAGNTATTAGSAAGRALPRSGRHGAGRTAQCPIHGMPHGSSRKCTMPAVPLRRFDGNAFKLVHPFIRHTQHIGKGQDVVKYFGLSWTSISSRSFSAVSKNFLNPVIFSKFLWLSSVRPGT